MRISTIFFTGFPGFLGTELLPLVLAREAKETTATCLIQAKFRAMAEGRVAELVAAHPALTDRIVLVDGDITATDLGLGRAYDAIAADATEVFHLAAVYDLAVPRALAMKVNVDGTRNVCDFAEAAAARHQYVSTCYVSGRITGVFSEDDLVIEGQTFNNFYEETKHLAEVIVRERMDAGHPTTIYRPAVVSGDSTTGATQKYDGPFFFIRLVDKQPGPVAVLPTVGDADAYTFNFVPRDFVVQGIAELSRKKSTIGMCFQLADPRPMSIRQLVEAIGKAAGRRIVTVPVPIELAKGAIDKIPGVQGLLELPSDSVNYLSHPVHYGSSNTQRMLADTDIAMPDHDVWLSQLVAFFRANPDITSAAMV
jgi:thioester reductase-like protein